MARMKLKEWREQEGLRRNAGAEKQGRWRRRNNLELFNGA